MIVNRQKKVNKNLLQKYDQESNNIPKLLAENSIEFCNSTNLHGFNHIFEEVTDDGTIFFRRIQKLVGYVIWIIAVSFGAAFAIYLMMLVWARFENTPTITTVETNNYPIWNIPFPAVTICNINSVHRPSATNLAIELFKRGIRRDKIYLFYSQLAKLINFSPIEKQFVNIFDTLDQLNYTTERLMLELAMPCQELFVKCSWLSKTMDCNSLFRFSKSSEGFCCSFNYRLQPSKALGEKLATFEQREEPIWRTAGSGDDIGLQVTVDIQPENYIAERKPYFGVNVLIHGSDEFPDSAHTHAVAQPGYEVGIAVSPSVVHTDESVRKILLKRRLCNFDDEKRLRIAGPYSFPLCMTECRALTIMKKCNCLPFFYPELINYNSSAQTIHKQCTLRDVECLADNKHIFSSLEPPPDKQIFFNKTDIGMDCNCYPSCSETRYDISVYTAKRFQNYSNNNNNNTLGTIDCTNLTVIKVYFKDLSCIKYRREIYMTWDGVLSSFGGIFGLCLGGSVISLIEFFYFMIIKLGFKIFANDAEYDPAIKTKEVLSGEEVLLGTDKFKPLINQSKNYKKQKNLPDEQQFLW